MLIYFAFFHKNISYLNGSSSSTGPLYADLVNGSSISMLISLYCSAAIGNALPTDDA